MELTRFPEFDNHEAVVSLSDKKSGLRGFIAIHNTNLGPATGGTRYWNYKSEDDALRDALRLARAMTYKCALAGVPFGGGKGVILANTHDPRKRKFLTAYAERINLFNGRFTTGEDVGITQEDVNLMLRHSKFINGKPHIAGDLSSWAALGVFYAMKGALNGLFHDNSFAERTVAIKGVGKLGMELCHLLHKEGARITVADINTQRVRIAKKRFPGVAVVSPREIHKQRVDIYAPCALGNEFSKKTIPQLRCQMICGGANNQLSTSEDGTRIHSWGILYVPDYLANAGGLINVVAELDKDGYSKKRVAKKVKAIQATTERILALSGEHNQPTSEVADRLAESIFLKKK